VTRPTNKTLARHGRASSPLHAAARTECKPYLLLAAHSPLRASCVTRPTVGDAVLDAMKFNHERFLWHCRLCLLMPDHLHAIMAFPREPGMVTTIKNWKKFVAGKHGVDWQRDFFDHRLRDHHELDEKTSYILMNPVRKGLCQQPEDWAWVYRPNDRPPPQW
jgi:putative transposase